MCWASDWGKWRTSRGGLDIAQRWFLKSFWMEIVSGLCVNSTCRFYCVVVSKRF